MINPFSLIGKNIIISGASSGIGRQCAISCSQMGANLILVDRNEEGLKQTFDKLELGNHLHYSQDIIKYDELESIIKDAVSKLGRISGFVHSAGIEITLPIKLMSYQHYEKLYAINAISAFEISKILSRKKYVNNIGASFIFIASIRGVLGESGAIGYCSSKGALISGMKAMALELSIKNIRVNCISPAIVKTEMINHLFEQISEKSKNEILNMHPMGFGKPIDIANACIYLLSDAARWITGTNFILDGGYSAR